MKHYLPTFEECMMICAKNDAFTHKVEQVGTETFHIFSYRLANYQDFMKHPGALEMRGLTFRGPLVGGQYERFLHLHKFFNHQEMGGHGHIEEGKVSCVRNKEDGSLITVLLINGKIHCKTKGTFGSEMAIAANKLITSNENLKKFIFEVYERGCIPLFEIVGYMNQIVLQYPEPWKLILLQIRNNTTGEYQSLE